MESLLQFQNAKESINCKLQIATLHISGWHLDETRTSEKLGQGIYLFVPGVKSKIHTAIPTHPSTPGLGERAVVLISLYGPDHIWCILHSTVDQAK